MSAEAPGVVLEFVGLPGAGKSTVAGLLEQAFESRGWSYANREMIARMKASRAERYGRLLDFFLRHPDELRAGLRLGLAVSPVSTVRLAQALKYVSVWSYRLAEARRQGYELVILDQGVIQDAWSLLLRGPWRDEMVHGLVSRTILRSGLSHALVYFDVPVEHAVRRIVERPTSESRFDLLDPADAARQLAAQGDRLEQLFTRVAERTGVRYCRVDASQSPTSLCGEIEAFLEASGRPAGLHAVPSQ